MDVQYQLTLADIQAGYPRDQYPAMRPNQSLMFRIIVEENGNVTFEAPTGSGKTLVEYTFLNALRQMMAQGKIPSGPLFLITPTKAIVEQIKALHPEVETAYGRSEFQCLYYEDEEFKADEVPCRFLVRAGKCSHYVDQQTGETHEAGAVPCPYYQKKYEAKQAPIVVSTMAFYLYTQLFSQEWGTPAGLVIDEAHRIGEVVRNCLRYEITDYHLKQMVEVVRDVDADASRGLNRFLRIMIRIVRSKPDKTPTLLEPDEIKEVMGVLAKINANQLQERIGSAIANGQLDPVEHRLLLKHLETLVRDLGRYLHSLGYALPTPEHHALDYVYAYYEEEIGEHQRVQYRLVIRAYYVAPLIQRILSPRTVSMSATIGSAEVFGFETGIRAPAYQLASDFPAENTRVYLPMDTEDLSYSQQKKRRGGLNKSLRQIVRAAHRFGVEGHRSLVILVSEEQRKKFLKFCEEEGSVALSYGEGMSAKEIAHRFKEGEGTVLVGTAAQYGEGIDLPDEMAPVIFFLKPDYARPDDPMTQFEERRYSRGMREALRQYRVMIRALQVRGRNVRSETDLGVTFFISKQFRKIVPAALPSWLWNALRMNQTFEQCVEETLQLLGRR